MIRALGVLLVLLWMPLAAAAQDIWQIEQDLTTLRYFPGPVDGVSDARTQRAIQQFQFGNGAYASGQLTARERTILRQMAQFATASGPFVLDATQFDSTTRAAIFGKRFLYANGVDYMSRWSFGIYDSRNGRLGKLYTVLGDANAARLRALRREAREIALSSGDPLARAISHLTQSEESENELRDTVSALEVVITQAEAMPGETAFHALLVGTLGNRMARYKLCEAAESAAFAPLVQRLLDLLIRTGASAEQLLYVLPHALHCLPEAQRDMVFQLRLDQARQISDDAIISTLVAWAEDARERGKTALAREKMRFVADHYFAQTPVRTGVHESVVQGLIPLNYIDLMYRVGMEIEARKFGAQRIARIEATHPSQVLEESRASLGAFDFVQRSTARTFIMTRQFDHLYRLGVYRRQHTGLKGPDAALWQPADTGPWMLAFDAMAVIWGDDKLVQQYDLAQMVLPQMLAAGAQAPALKVSLLQAQVAEELGRFEQAEAAIVRTVSIGQSLGMPADVQAEIRTLQRALNLSRLDGLSAAEKLLEQMNIHYGAACASLEAAQRTGWDFPDFDYDAIARDPEVAAALIRTDAMNQLLGCYFPQRLQNYEVRFICAVAGIAGRRDVAEYLLRGTNPDNAQYAMKPFSERCVMGLATVGRLDWVQAHMLPEGEAYETNFFAYMGQDPASRARISAQSRLDELPDLRGNRRIPLRFLEKDLSRFERKKLAETFHIRFAGGFGNMGPQPPDEAEVLHDGIALHRAGFFRAAEIHYANDQRVDPFAFGTETPAILDEDLTRPGHVALRLRYARLYRDQGDSARAYQAIGPLAERAIARLAADPAPLPGTVEQWAKRFEALFTAYLQVQFEGLPQGPNYPAIFAIQQYLSLANSTASASVLEQRLNSASPEIARQYQDARRALRRALDAAGGDQGAVAELSLQLQAIEARLPRQDAARQSHQIGVTRPLREVILELRAAQSAMVVATQLPEQLILMYLDGQGARARTHALNRAGATAEVAAFRRSLLDSDDTRDLFDPAGATRLYDTLIGWGHAGRAGPTSLRLVMDGPLSTLPFAALRRADGWLGAQAALRLSPSVARAASGLRQGEGFRGFVGLGDPNLTKGNLSARTALLGGGLFLPELPETANELTFMALSFGGNPSADVFTRQEASEARLQTLNAQARLSDISILALATHGLLSRETGALNAAGLVLSLPEGAETDGILTATEIYSYRIGADLVVLSACNTGTPGAGEGLSDLASAFLYAGAGALLLTHWEIDSGAGVEIMKRIALDQRARQGADYASSLQSALGGMLADPGLEKYHHPRFWASHFILG